MVWWTKTDEVIFAQRVRFIKRIGGKMVKQRIDKKLTKAELFIMKIIWDAESEVTMKYLTDELKERYQREYARTTIATFLSRMEGKGYVHQERRGKYTYITAIKDEKEYQEAMLLDTMDLWFDGDLVSMFEFIIKQDNFTKEDRDIVAGILDKMIEEN